MIPNGRKHDLETSKVQAESDMGDVTGEREEGQMSKCIQSVMLRSGCSPFLCV